VLAKALASAGAAESAPSNPIQYGGPAPAGLAVHSGLTQEREAGSESRLESRLDSDRAALRETPDDPFAHLTYGMYAFGEQRAHTAAAWAFQRGAELAPDLPFVVFGMPYLLMHALQHRCDFAAVDVWEPKLQLAMEAAINCILKQECGPNEEYRFVYSDTARVVSNAYTALTNPVTFRRPELLLSFLQSRYALEVQPPPLAPGSWARVHRNANSLGDPNRKLHFAYITGVPSAHVTYELVGLLPLLHSSSVSLSWYTLQKGDVHFLKSVGWFRNVRLVDLSDLSHAEAAARIREDGVQVLVDLDAHIEVSASKPSPVISHGAAPVVIQWLGWAGTSGHPRVQYAGLDAMIAPPTHAHLFSERLALLPGTYQANNHALKWLETISPSPGLRAESTANVLSGLHGLNDTDAEQPAAGDGSRRGLDSRRPIACSYNQLFKLSGEIFANWRNVMRRTPPAAIVQGAGVSHGRKYSISDAPRNLHASAHADGVNANAQLFFAKALPKPTHLMRMSAMCDLALDTLHYNSHTTGADALWSATPMVTLRGLSMASRVAASLSATAGIADTTVFSYREYEDLASALLR